MAVAPARPDGRPPCRLRGYGPTRGLALRDMLSYWENLSPFTVPRAPMRVYDETSGDVPIKGRRIVATMLDDAIGSGMRQREIFSVSISRRGAVTVSIRRWDWQKWPTCSGKNVRVHTPRHQLVAVGAIPASDVHAIWRHFGPTRHRLIVAVVRQLLATNGPSSVPAFGQAVRTVGDTVQALIPISPATRGRPVLVNFRGDQTAEITPLSYRVRENGPSGRAVIVPIAGWEDTQTVHRLDLQAVSLLSPTRQFIECRNEFVDRINPLLHNPFVCRGDPLLTPPSDALDVGVTNAIQAAVGDIVAATGPYDEGPLTVAYQVEFPRYDVVMLALTLPLKGLMDEIRSAIRDILIAAASPPVGTYTFYGQSINLTRLSDWSLAVRPPNLTYAHASAHERMLARRRLALMKEEPG